MIITIKGADFSSANIGTLSTYIISKSISRGASFNIPSFVEKNSSVNWVITLDEDYTFGTYSITMGSEIITPTINGSEMTIAIANVTGNIRITIATVYNGVEELPEPDEPNVPTFKDTITIDAKNFVKNVDIMPTDAEYHVDGVAFSTRYWVGAASQTDATKRGVYYLTTFPINDSEYLSCCVNVEDAIANGYTKIKVIKTNVNSTADGVSYYSRRTSTSTDWTVGKEQDRISCPNNTEIALNGYKSIWFGLRKIAKDGTTTLYAGDSVTFKFIK